MSPIAQFPRLSRLFVPFALLWVYFLFAVPGCGSSSPDADAGDRPDSESVEAIKITAAAALLARAQQPGTQERVVLCEQILADHPESPEAEEALYLLARVDQNANRYADAFAKYRRLVGDYPAGQFAALAHEYIWSYQSKIAGDSDGHAEALRVAIADLRARLAEHPAEWLRATGTALAMAHLEGGDAKGAMEVYASIVGAPATADPIAEQTRITGQFHLGTLLLQEGETAKARDAYRKGLEMAEANDVIDSVARDSSIASFRAAMKNLPNE